MKLLLFPQITHTQHYKPKEEAEEVLRGNPSENGPIQAFDLNWKFELLILINFGQASKPFPRVFTHMPFS